MSANMALCLLGGIFCVCGIEWLWMKTLYLLVGWLQTEPVVHLNQFYGRPLFSSLHIRYSVLWNIDFASILTETIIVTTTLCLIYCMRCYSWVKHQWNCEAFVQLFFIKAMPYCNRIPHALNEQSSFGRILSQLFLQYWYGLPAKSAI